MAKKIFCPLYAALTHYSLESHVASGSKLAAVGRPRGDPTPRYLVGDSRGDVSQSIYGTFESNVGLSAGKSGVSLSRSAE